MRYMLDTNMLIYMLKNRPPAVASRVAALQAQDPDCLCMSFVTWAELLKGAERSRVPGKVRERLRRVAESIPVLFEVSPAMCEHQARLAVTLKAQGTPIGANDLWIAAHALAEGCALVTNNQREFMRVPGLELDNWVEA